MKRILRNNVMNIKFVLLFLAFIHRGRKNCFIRLSSIRKKKNSFLITNSRVRVKFNDPTLFLSSSKQGRTEERFEEQSSTTAFIVARERKFVALTMVSLMCSTGCRRTVVAASGRW